MRLRNFSLDRALDTWSDFAIECWAFTLRLALAGLGVFYAWGLAGRWNEAVFDRIFANWLGIIGFIFAGGVLLAILYRLERAFSKEKKHRGPQLSGGRNAPAKKRQRSRWGNRKRKRNT
ncbi:hypothetical protein Q9K02_14235 [Qipengyuania sp. G39]|uniref:Uncharacterized protein n=1 Tax=Qipengyuania profundimaris TaxID=3067652 RepID=A0ABT9HT19_9SPHN|nr:hypothetical protein [Qipengyuania sp. G39]MDP4576296.1 hypothetical protein [Qipengyuania sp. G39]